MTKPTTFCKIISSNLVEVRLPQVEYFTKIYGYIGDSAGISSGIPVFLISLFHHLMQIAYKIIADCIYKCNLHLQLVVGKMGIIYNKNEIKDTWG